MTLNAGATAGTATIRATAAGRAFGTTSVTITSGSLYKLFIPVQVGIPAETAPGGAQ